MVQTIIDWKRIADLESELGQHGFAEIVEIFIEDTEAMVAALQTAPEAEYADRVHGIKGSAESFGMKDLSMLCRESEWALKRGETIDVAAFDEGFRRSCAALVEGLQDQTRNSASVVSSVISV